VRTERSLGHFLEIESGVNDLAQLIDDLSSLLATIEFGGFKDLNALIDSCANLFGGRPSLEWQSSAKYHRD
jgi:hypothetical protein